MATTHTREQRAQQTIRKIEKLAAETLAQIQASDNPTLQIPIRALSNVSWNEDRRLIELGDRRQSREFFNLNMAKKFMQTFLVAAACKELLKSGKTTSIRDLFYMTKHTIKGSRENTFDDQTESDPIIEDLEVTVDALREELHLFAAKRGSMVGPMTIVDAGDTINLARMGSGGWSIPSITENHVIQFKQCEAEYILLVEKEAVWHRLNEDKFWKKHKCILVTGNGQATRGVRRLLQRMHNELKIPLYVLVDNDPWGLYIFSVVKQRSISLAYESMRMAVPTARFLGLRTRDFKTFGLSDDVRIALEKEDENRARQMLSYPWFAAKHWQTEIKDMLKAGFKMEIEALSNKDISFVTDVYIPQKITKRDWLV
ncbi:MAG TPA: DNA topoisomerase IV subunit A [Polyangiaceae bacterium]|nr:DNA topoisomerase IV subunit A [Polyangiaceae bacterium]